MADNVKWFKLTNNMFEDEKIEYLESMPDGDALINIWTKTLCLASKCNAMGDLMLTNEIPYTYSMLSIKFKKTIEQVTYAYTLMQKLGMINLFDDIISVSNWSKYQNVDGLEAMKEYNRIKQQESRIRKKNLQLEKDVNDKSMTNVKNLSISNSLSLSISNIFTYWNTKEIIKHIKLTDERNKAITKALKTYKEDKLIELIDRYKIVLDSDYFFSFKWTLVDFLSRKNGISTFTDEGTNWNNYLEFKKKPKQATQHKEEFMRHEYTDKQLKNVLVNIEDWE